MSSTDPAAPEADEIETSEPPGSEEGDELTDGVAEADLPGVAESGERL
jgi:hypothetical protein